MQTDSVWYPFSGTFTASNNGDHADGFDWDVLIFCLSGCTTRVAILRTRKEPQKVDIVPGSVPPSSSSQTRTQHFITVFFTTTMGYSETEYPPLSEKETLSNDSYDMKIRSRRGTERWLSVFLIIFLASSVAYNGIQARSLANERARPDHCGLAYDAPVVYHSNPVTNSAEYARYTMFTTLSRRRDFTRRRR
ncbi:hypothetical protein K458DRAFT_399881 [Lentithecium fluviatile CBS 122367]|uniref:Uncharacterized protein n=1 Tax=Lentithecium fluviatile CBS 122367 TaxID=1168545 RepID=A0A6G1JF24_9PLEO|nr:hypothetical protein K458DRAFT_399881 [Lentithecium fluviatile CBS 122367]